MLTIRNAIPADAAALVSYLQNLFAYPDHNSPLIASEFSRTIAEQERMLGEFQNEANSAYFLAFENERIVR